MNLNQSHLNISKPHLYGTNNKFEPKETVLIGLSVINAINNNNNNNISH
jgi:hypothetical protein